MFFEKINTFFIDYPYLKMIFTFLWIFFLSAIVYKIVRKLIQSSVMSYVKKSKSELERIISKSTVLSRLAFIVPVLIIYNFAHFLPGAEAVIQKICSALIIFLVFFVVSAVLDLLSEIYSKTQISNELPIKSYLQVAKIIIFIICGIIIISIISDKSPLVLLSGIGAMTAVLLLIFRDTILSFTAIIQINVSDLIKVGDWIEAPSFGADGDVIDIALYQVKIQNFDKTISTIPTHKLIESPYKNWRGMSQSGGRRIKRSIYIDVSTVQFCDEKMLKRFERIQLLTQYTRKKFEEITQFNKENRITDDEIVDGRRMTNLGTFRAYVENYLRQHPKIHQGMTLLIRQLQSTERGIPIEIYAFTNVVDWEKYERIQADIIDHILAVIPEFGLRLFQNPSGTDFQIFKKRKNNE